MADVYMCKQCDFLSFNSHDYSKMENNTFSMSPFFRTEEETSSKRSHNLTKTPNPVSWYERPILKMPYPYEVSIILNDIFSKWISK